MRRIGVVAATLAITAVETIVLGVGIYWSMNGTSSQIALQEPSDMSRSYLTNLSSRSSFLKSPSLYGAFLGGHGLYSSSSFFLFFGISALGSSPSGKGFDSCCTGAASSTIVNLSG